MGLTEAIILPTHKLLFIAFLACSNGFSRRSIPYPRPKLSAMNNEPCWLACIGRLAAQVSGLFITRSADNETEDKTPYLFFPCLDYEISHPF